MIYRSPHQTKRIRQAHFFFRTDHGLLLSTQIKPEWIRRIHRLTVKRFSLIHLGFKPNAFGGFHQVCLLSLKRSGIHAWFIPHDLSIPFLKSGWSPTIEPALPALEGCFGSYCARAGRATGNSTELRRATAEACNSRSLSSTGALAELIAWLHPITI